MVSSLMDLNMVTFTINFDMISLDQILRFDGWMLKKSSNVFESEDFDNFVY